ncbi:MAG: tetratricopeptide repeat protein, partial [Planctomycetes bacterium]|nr:tetratricopeptide repeat protein [Planctomycetota bacterium]
MDNPWVRSLRNLPRFFTPRFWNEDHLAHGESYRPLEQVAFALGHALWRNSPIGYHALNGALYLAAVSLAYAVLARILAGRRAAFFAALLFAVHPVHSEAVNWLKNVVELLCFIWLSLSFLTWLKFAEATRRRWLAISVVSFMLALLCKEGAIVLPALLAASVLALRPRPAWRRGLWATAPHWALALVYLVFTRLTLKPGPPDPLEESLTAFSPALPSFTLWTYEKLLLLPINLCVDRGFAVPQAALGLTLLSVGVLVALTWLAFSDRQAMRPVALFGLCWFLLALAPYVNLIPIRVRPLAEQRLFTASLGFCLLLALALHALRFTSYVSRFTLLALLLATLSIHRNFIWRDLRAMSLDTTLSAPAVARTRHNLGYGYWLQDNPAAAEKEYRHALRLRRTPMTLRSLALARASRGDTEQAIGLLHESLALRPEAITHRL